MAFLHSIRLRGFKTFARPTELAFEPGVTVIIGPNGSGKSNVADAVLWVLGEQSPGNLRGRTMQDVIFTGPDGKRSSAVAEVGLVFDNTCGSLPLDCSQVEIIRRLMRDGTSEYRINGASCRLLDVQDLVGGLGLGREMHSVISQGKVEALLNSTPAARRALVEEAAGLGRFKKRRERAHAKLERVGQNLLRVNDVEREVRNALRPMRQQVAAAERYVQATEEWAQARARYVLFELIEARRVCADKEQSLTRARERLAAVQASLADLRKRKAVEEERFTDALREREELGAVYLGARSEVERLDSRAVSLRQRLARIEGELARAKRRQELAESESAASVLRLGEAGLDDWDETRLGWVGAVTQALRTEADEMLPLFRATQKEEDDTKDAVFELETARTRALQERDYLRREAADRARIRRELSGLKAAVRGRLKEVTDTALDLESRRAASARTVEEALCAVESAFAARAAKRATVDETAREEARLGELLAGVDSRRSVLEQVLERKEGLPGGARNLLKAVVGARVLTDLLTVEPGYERALTAALGPIVNAVVIPGPPDPSAALRGEGLLEVIWPDEVRSAPAPSSAAPPAGARDLWELVRGPEAVLATLRRLAPRVAVVEALDGLQADSHGGAGGEQWCVVSRKGEVAQLGLHAARRSEVGAEALLSARGELENAVTERLGLADEQGGAHAARAAAAVEAERADQALKAAEEVLTGAERQALAEGNEADLHARRTEEAEAQLAELITRDKNEEELAAQMEADLLDLEATISEREAGLEQARDGLRSGQARLESLRQRVAKLEEKKSQAALLEVRLRERSRAHQLERQRALAQRESSQKELARCTRRLDALSRYLPALVGLQQTVEALAALTRGAVGAMEARVDEVRGRSEEAARVMRDWGGAESESQREHDGLAAGIAELQVEQVRLADRRAVLEEELGALCQRHLSPRSVRPEDVGGADPEALLSAIDRAEKRRERIGPVNPLAEQECREAEERAGFLAEQRRDLEASTAQLRDVIGELDEHINASFMQIFDATREHFASVIATVFPGAKGTLRLTEPAMTGPADEGLDEGVDDGGERGEDTRGVALEVKLPNKSPRSMSLLSGGEKAMTAIAFLFSLFLARPCPFYILDEVEASLDDLNIRRFLSLIRSYGDRTQFIIITHQRQTMEVADTLYGVALESDGTSRVLSRRFRRAEDGGVLSGAVAAGGDTATTEDSRGSTPIAQGA